jgi:hypothetical protein
MIAADLRPLRWLPRARIGNFKSKSDIAQNEVARALFVSEV